MNWVWHDPLPPSFWPVLMVALSVCFAFLAVTRARGGWFAPLASVNCFLIAAESVVLSHPELAPWRAQVLVMRLWELPIVTGICALCLVQAGVLAWPGHAAAPFGEAAFRPRLRRVLKAAPAAMFSAWFLALLGQMIWPVPMFDPFARMTTRDFFVIAPLCLPILFYLVLLAWVFAKAAGPRTPSLRLRAKNLFLFVGIFSYFLMTLNVVVGYGVQAFAPEELHRPIMKAQFVLDDNLLLVVVVALPAGLALGTTSAAGDLLLRAAYPALLKLRDRTEARRWQLAASGKLRRLTRVLYHANSAADLLAMSGGERARTVAAVELASILTDSSDNAPEITPEESRRLLALQRELLHDERLAEILACAKTLDEDSAENRETTFDDPLHDALEAALVLTENRRQVDTSPERFDEAPWFHLAAVAAEAAGIVQQVPRTGIPSGELTRRRVVRAYEEAAMQIAARSATVRSRR
jgi:hypothetical protein